MKQLANMESQGFLKKIVLENKPKDANLKGYLIFMRSKREYEVSVDKIELIIKSREQFILLEDGAIINKADISEMIPIVGRKNLQI